MLPGGNVGKSQLAAKPKKRGARLVGDLVTGVIDPALRKKAGISISLLRSWSEIAGQDLAERTRPLKIDWPRRDAQGDDFKPGTLVLACDQSVVLKIQYQTGELISRLNSFFGYSAVERIRLVQRPVTPWRDMRPKPEPKLSDDESARIAEITRNIDDSGLRKSLERLGRSIIGDRSS